MGAENHDLLAVAENLHLCFLTVYQMTSGDQLFEAGPLHAEKSALLGAFPNRHGASPWAEVTICRQ